MHKQKGFTLIELIMVLVLLSILAVVAVPRYIDLQASAQQASLNGVLGAVRSAASIAHAQYLVSGSAPDEILMGGQSIALIHGYPAASHIPIAASLGLSPLVPGEQLQIDGISISLDDTGTSLFQLGNCHFSYQQALSINLPPLISELNCTP